MPQVCILGYPACQVAAFKYTATPIAFGVKVTAVCAHYLADCVGVDRLVDEQMYVIGHDAVGEEVKFFTEVAKLSSVRL